jgi:hypothetical protein
VTHTVLLVKPNKTIYRNLQQQYNKPPWKARGVCSMRA